MADDGEDRVIYYAHGCCASLAAMSPVRLNVQVAGEEPSTLQASLTTQEQEIERLKTLVGTIEARLTTYRTALERIADTGDSLAARKAREALEVPAQPQDGRDG